MKAKRILLTLIRVLLLPLRVVVLGCSALELLYLKLLGKSLAMKIESAKLVVNKCAACEKPEIICDPASGDEPMPLNTVISIGRYLRAMDSRSSDEKLKAFREKAESGKGYPAAVRHCKDRRLYAVSEPTRQENLQRILNVMCETDVRALCTAFIDHQEIFR